MSEPRAISLSADRWLTDSRVYNLIWMGRWLERAENIARAANAAALKARQSDDADSRLSEELREVAATLGVPLPDDSLAASEIILRNSASSIMQSLAKARLNATQVAPVELIRPISEMILDMEECDPALLRSSERVIEITSRVIDGMADINATIEDAWFGGESLTEEEVYRRFVQQ